MKEERLVSNMNKCGNREGWLDSLRAFAVLLVVVGHIAELWDDDFMRYLNRGLYLFHMPLFFVMSGITFEMFTIKSQIDLRKIWVKRVGNLLIPAFFFVLVQFLFDSKRDIFTVYSGVWFLVFLALVLSVEIIILMFERNKGKKSGGGVFYVLITGVLWILFGIVCIILDEKGFVVFGKLAREISKFFGYLICFRYGRYAIRCKDTAWKIDFHFFCAAACFVVIQVTAALIDVGANTTLLRMMCGLAGSRVIVSLFYYFRKQVTWLENLVSKYSVEIYMLHGNIVHKLILVPVLSVLNFRETEMMIVFCLISLVADFGLSLGIAFMERFFVPINFIFHPMGYLEKRD